MTDTAPAMVFSWDGEALWPLAPKLADKHFVVGERYRMAPYEERSAASHSHYFASIADAWQNLPDHLAEQFQSSEHLRKYALIKAGYCDKRSIVSATEADANRMASFIKPLDEYAVVTVSERVVTVYTAKSQSTRAMGRAAFQDSKEKVLQIVADLVGVKADDLKRNAKEAVR